MERGDGWKQIADRLNKIESPNFECTARSVREHFQTLIEKRKVVNREEERASVISPEITEVDILLDELLEVFSSAAFDQQAAEKEKLEQQPLFVLLLVNCLLVDCLLLDPEELSP
eukprot:gene12122-2727_t